MTQHFLLSAKARTLSIKRLFDMSEDQAFDLFRELRWGKGEEVTCPCCGSVAKHYFIHPSPMALQGLQAHLLGYVRDDLRFPQAAAEDLPDRHRDLHQCGEGHFGTATVS